MLSLVTCRGSAGSAGCHQVTHHRAELQKPPDTPRHPQPCSSQAQHRLHHRSEASNTFGLQNPAEGSSCASRLSLGLALDQVLCQRGSWHITWWLGHEYLRAKCSPKLFYNTRTHLPRHLFRFQPLQRNLFQFVPNSSAITEALADNGKGLSGFNLKFCILISEEIS